MNVNGNDSTGRLSHTVTLLTRSWGKPAAVRGGREARVLSAVFQALEGPISEILPRAEGRVDFLNMAPQRLGGPADMGIVSGELPEGVAYLARIFPSATEGRFDVDIRLELGVGAADTLVPHSMFEAVSEILGERIYEEGLYAQFMAHLLKNAGAHRARFYGELAQLVADYVQAPDEAP